MNAVPTISRSPRRLRLVASDGHRMGEQEQDLQLTEEQAETELIDAIDSIRGRLPGGSDYRVLLATLGAELEQRRSDHAPPPSSQS